MQKKSYSKVNLFIRTCFFYIMFSLVTIVFGFLLMVLRLFPLRMRTQVLMDYGYTLLFLAEKICLIHYRLTGVENIPKQRNVIILCKHQSSWETIFIPLYFKVPSVITKRELLWLPFFGWILASTDPIAINRKEKKHAMETVIVKGGADLASGRNILIFPEGTRINFGEIGKYKLGGARLAAETGYPVLPVAHNSGYFWPKQFIKQPGTITVAFGPLIESKGKDEHEILQLARDWIEATVKKIEIMD